MFKLFLLASIYIFALGKSDKIQIATIQFKVIQNGDSDRRYIWLHGDEQTARMALENHMKKNQYDVVCPQSNDEIETDPDYLNLSSGYIKRSLDIFPQQGKKEPWRNNQNFLKDVFQIRYGRIDDGEISFSFQHGTFPSDLFNIVHSNAHISNVDMMVMRTW